MAPTRLPWRQPDDPPKRLSKESSLNSKADFDLAKKPGKKTRS